MRVKLTAGMVLLVLASACAPPDTSDPTATTGSLPAGTVVTTTTLPLVPGCAASSGFVEGGEIAAIGQPASDSTALGSISWDADPSCETFTFAFASSEGAPATTPPEVRARYLDGVPIIRLDFDIASTSITDQIVETGLVDRLYVVRALDGGMFVDLHLAAPAQALVESSSSPAAITLHLQPGIVDLGARPALSDSVIVTSPLDGATTPAVVEVTGYSRTFEANVLLIATVGDQVVARESTPAADWTETWGEFRTSLELPAGQVSVFVGEESPKDGSLNGIPIRLTVGE